MVLAVPAIEPHLDILHTLAQTINRSLDVEEVLSVALDALTHVTGHEISSLHLLSADGATVSLKSDRGLSPDLREANRELPIATSVIGRSAATGKTFCVQDASSDPLTFEGARAAVRGAGIRGFVCVPIHGRGRILGTLSLGRHTPRPFDEAEIALVEVAADQIGVAIDNAELYTEALDRLRELEAVRAQLIHAERLSAVGQLASGVAHEINNPLTAIRGQVHLLCDDPDLNGRTRHRLALVAREVSRAARIVRNLLNFARHHPPERQP